MALPVISPIRRPKGGIVLAAALTAIILLVIVLAASYLGQKAKRTRAMTELAARVLTLELNLGKGTLKEPLAYQPFHRFIVPGSQAAKWTQWILTQDLAAPTLRPKASHWWTRRAAVVTTRHGHPIVTLNIYWWRTFQPRGESTGIAAVSMRLRHTPRGWKVNGLAWNSNPGLGPNQPDSFAYDFQKLTGIGPPPQGDPPPLKPRANNP